MHFHDDLLDSDASVSYSSPRKTAEKSASRPCPDADFSVSYESFSLFYVHLTFFMLRFAWRIFIPLRSGPGSRAQCFLRCNGYQTVRDQYH